MGFTLAEPENETIELLDGGAEAFPRMLAAIDGAERTIRLEVYAFYRDHVGGRFVDSLVKAALRGVEVQVVLDGWGSARDGEEIAAELESAGCKVTVYNPVWALVRGHLARNHRKLLVVDENAAFVGGINIGDDYAADRHRPGWADLAVEIRGPSCKGIGRAKTLVGRKARVLLSSLGRGFTLRRLYTHGISRAKDRVLLAHAYFLPGARFTRSIARAARRGVKVSLLLAGRSDVPFAKVAQMRLYNQLLSSGVRIFEWERSVLHAKAAAIDGERLLVGSFNLDPLSLANLEALVEVEDPAVVARGERWITEHIALAREIRPEDCHRSRFQALVVDLLGLWTARTAQWLARLITVRRRLV